MKIEKLNKDNIKEFIRDMKLDDTENLEFNVNKSELYAVKKDDIFYLGFNSLAAMDRIAILYCNPKLSNELFYECTQFLNKSLVVENYLIIDVYEEKYMKLLDEKYKCKEMIVTLGFDDNINIKKDIINDKYIMKEKFIDIEMKSIKYSFSCDMVSCNLVKQNIQDEKMIFALHEYFKTLDVNSINFIIYSDSYECFKALCYKTFSKSYAIK